MGNIIMSIVKADCYRCPLCGLIGWVYPGETPDPCCHGDQSINHPNGEPDHDWEFEWSQKINTEENEYIG